MPTPSKVDERIQMEPSPKRLRTFLGGVCVADTLRPMLVWEIPFYPAYYFPLADVRMELLTPDGGVRSDPMRGDARTYTVRAGGKKVAGAALRYEDSPIAELRDLVRFDWDAMDGWFEEDEEVFRHPRDPYKRVDILSSSRHVRVEVDGVTVAESSNSRFLFETGLPVRYYLPKTHVRMDLLEPTDRSTQCPYKGQASYWSVRAGDKVYPDLAWSYRSPFPESQKIASMIAFYNEKVDIYLDGVRQERPKTHFA